MKHVRIIRVERTENGLIGVLTIDGLVECFTLQPDEADVHFSIPAGNYLCKRFHGTKYSNTFEIVVPGHTALLFHILNQEDESHGCIGVGERVGYLRGKRAILNSAFAFEQFMKKLGADQEFNLVIQNCI